MGYSDGETLVLARLRAQTNFSTSNTSQGDYSILTKGKSKHYGILRPGPMTIEWQTPLMYHAPWTTVIEIWQKYRHPADSYTELIALQKEVIDGFMPYRFIGATDGSISDATPRSTGDIMELWPDQSGKPEFLKWEVNIEWVEEVEVTLQE